MHLGIVAQRGNERAAELARDLVEILTADDLTVSVDAATGDTLDRPGVDVSEMATCDLVVSIGGDGTFLYAARGAASTPIIGVNLGEVGFLNAIAPADAIEAVTAEVERLRSDGRVASRELPRLQAENGDWSLEPAINEIVFQGPQRGHGMGADFEVRIDGDVYTTGHADGVLVSTPTGSTAYNLSEGGPLVHPGLDAVVVTEMCPTDSMPPLVVDADSTVSVTVSDADDAFVVSDGRTRKQLDPPTTVTVETAGAPVRLAGGSADYFEALKKLE
ncbi:NAD(+)/NADH kinase [Natranaeroarchaeum aerophilus]|uniref:NAD kinase n=1 Tax=Natranaeroarchaeum aerophilus TaxID=2917711 RepID=A0AAE3K3X9_9EURY|nr:NAD(+)/NADH kinase [Natranaeroarchaeum aerophilus]MCL9812803.1 NAD(+)/NADH kinase [Natranaeroarchaeum aerophilus]